MVAIKQRILRKSKFTEYNAGIFVHDKAPSFKKYVLKPNLINKKFDIIFIDGRSRIKCLINSLDLIKKNGVIIFDNSNRKEYKKAIHNFPLKRKTFAGLCPTLPYISETTFFFN